MSRVCSHSDTKATNDLSLGMVNVEHFGSDDDFTTSLQVGIAAGPCFGQGEAVINPQVYVDYGLPLPGSLHSLSTGMRLSYYHTLFSDDFSWNVAPSIGTRANFTGGPELSGWRGLAAGLDAAVFWNDEAMRVGPRVGVQGTFAGDYGISAGLDWGWDF